MQVNFDEIPLEQQKHPGISTEVPFDIAWSARHGPEEELHGDVHYALQMTIIVAGAAEVVFHNHSRICRAGEMWWTMCWEPHACRLLDKHNFALSINLNANRIGDCGPFADADFLLPFSVPPAERFSPRDEAGRRALAATARQLFHWYSRRPPLWKSRSWLAIHGLLLDAIEAIGARNPLRAEIASGDFGRIRPAVNQVHAAAGKVPALDEAARLCALSPSRFSTIFKNCMGVSYGQFALRSRLAAAARDVAKGQYTMEDIAARWGFCDASSFCNAFKKVYRCRPAQFSRGNRTD